MEEGGDKGLLVGFKGVELAAVFSFLQMQQKVHVCSGDNLTEASHLMKNLYAVAKV